MTERISDEWLAETLASMDGVPSDVLLHLEKGPIEDWLLDLRDARERIRELERMVDNPIAKSVRKALHE